MILLRASVYLFVLKVCLVSHSYCCQIERLIPDFADLYAISKVAVVINTEELKQPINGLGLAYISYNNVKLQDVLGYINDIQDELEAMFFIGSDHSELIQMLNNSTDIFHSHIVSVMRDIDILDMHFRLDTNIIFCSSKKEEHYDLFEKYAVKKGPITTRYIGNWKAESRLHIETPLLWERRSDLMNVVLTNTVLEYSVISQFSKNKGGDILKQSGIGPDILAILQDKLNFSTRAVSPQDGVWGSITGNNATWSGIVGDLVNGKADLSSAFLVRSYERNDAVDFSVTLIEFTVTLVQPNTISSEINALAYLTIFPTLAWIMIFAMVIISAVLIAGIAKACERIEISLGEASVISFLYLLQWSHDKPTLLTTRAARVGLFTWAIGCYVVFSFYEADLTAVMTSGSQQSNIRSFDDALARDYQVVTLQESAWEDLLKLAPLGTSRRRYYDAKMRDVPSSRLKTQQDMIEVTLSEPKTLIWETSLYFAEDNRLRALNILDSSMSLGPFAYQKGSEFHGIFDYHLMKMKQSGILDKVKSIYLPDPPLTIGISEANQLGYDNLMFPGIVITFGIIGALIILLVEALIEFFNHAAQVRQASMPDGSEEGRWAKSQAVPNIFLDRSSI